MIHQIAPYMLREDILREIIYPDLEQTLYWTDDWDPSFYKELAQAGFISISHAHPDLGPILIPELQADYAVLDWENLHCSSRLQRLRRSNLLEEEGVRLQIVDSCDRVLARIIDYHQPRTWLTAPYQDLLRTLSSTQDPHFKVHSVELWSHKRDQLIAGEIGYSTGTTYTSLSGFTTRHDPMWRSFGTLQMVLLAERLETLGYAFWNMGHTQQDYKLALGARVIPRERFLGRWIEATRRDPPILILEEETPG